jgi:WXG100 family type VII secretion target
MASIVVTPENVKKTGDDMVRKKQELEEIIKRAKTMIDGLRGEFKGNLANQVFKRWDEVYPNLSKSFENLQAAGDVLKKAGDAFQQADDTKIG